MKKAILFLFAIMMMACGDMSTSDKQTVRSAHVEVDDIAETDVMELSSEVDYPLRDTSEMGNIFNDAYLSLGNFVHSQEGPNRSGGIFWISQKPEDKPYPYIRLSIPLGHWDFDKIDMILERRPVPSSKSTEVLGYAVGFKKMPDDSYKYFAESSRYVNGEMVESDSISIVSPIQMRVAVAPFYERIWQATLFTEKSSHVDIARVLKTS